MKVNRSFPAHRKGEKEAADPATNLVADYVAKHGIARAFMSRGTGVSEGILQRCLSARERSLRASEFIKICTFLGVDPQIFAADERPGGRFREEVSEDD